MLLAGSFFIRKDLWVDNNCTLSTGRSLCESRNAAFKGPGDRPALVKANWNPGRAELVTSVLSNINADLGLTLRLDAIPVLTHC